MYLPIFFGKCIKDFKSEKKGKAPPKCSMQNHLFV